MPPIMRSDAIALKFTDCASQNGPKDRSSDMLEPQAREWMSEAIVEAEKSRKEGGVPVGALLADPATGEIVSRGHNRMVQTGDATAHAEVVAIRNAGRRLDWDKLVLVSTLSPCIMCTGHALLFKIPRVLVGENKTFFSYGEDIMRQKGVRLDVLQDKEIRKPDFADSRDSRPTK